MKDDHAVRQHNARLQVLHGRIQCSCEGPVAMGASLTSCAFKISGSFQAMEGVLSLHRAKCTTTALGLMQIKLLIFHQSAEQPL